MTDTRTTWDQGTNVRYVRFCVAEVTSTISLSSTVYIDADSAGNFDGMEVPGVDSHIFSMRKEFPDTATLRDWFATPPNRVPHPGNHRR